LLQEKEKRYIINTYNRRPEQTLLLVRGRGTLVWDEAGKEYLDFVGGIAVNALGHAYRPVLEAAWEQMQKVIHTSNLYYSGPQIELAECLVKNSVGDKVFFCNSGAEANEAAIKLARKYYKTVLQSERFEIITALNSFHGRTLATVAATGQEKFHRGFEPLPAGFCYARFNDLESFRSQINERTAAIMVEPLQGEGGVHPGTADFLKGLRRLCDEKELLLIFDEVQSGMGRTGRLFAYEHAGIKPDIFTSAKALGGGFPIGAMLCAEKVAAGFAPGDHASTFGGNPVACAAALAVLQAILKDGFLDEVASKGRSFQDKLQLLAGRFLGIIVEIRGKGLITGVELSGRAGEVQRACQEKGLLLNAIGEHVLRFLPPLNVTREELDAALEILEWALEEVFGSAQGK